MRNGVRNSSMLIIGGLCGAMVLGFLLLLGNCVMTGKTCPPYGLRETLEDLVGLLLGFVAGRMTK